MEGEFRACHTGIISHAEEIAFYRGNNWEKVRVNDIFSDLLVHIDDIYSKRFFMGIFDSLILKYGSVSVGYCLLGVPFFGKNNNQYTSSSDIGVFTRDYISNSQNLINLSKVN